MISGLFGNHFEGNLRGHFLVETDGGNVVAYFLDGLLDFDELAVNVVAELFESFGNLDCVYGAEDGAGGAGLCADGQRYAFEGGCGCFCVGFDFGELVAR